MLIKQIPQSDATNVFDLLQDVKATILEEPKRVRMTCYQRTVPPAENGPSCGTVGCFAGWCLMLSGMMEHARRSNDTFSRFTQKVLGNDLKYVFNGHHYFNAGSGDGLMPMHPGTRAYARKVAARINRFIADNGGKKVLSGRSVNRSVR